MALTFIGETDFRQSGPPQWQQSLWDLDSLVIPYSGAEPNLNSFLDNLEKGAPSDIDQDMFLMDWRVSGSKAYPQVDLIYSGKKNGQLPEVRVKYSSSVQSVTSQVTNTGELANSPVTMQFYAPSSQATWISNAPGALGTAPDPITAPSVISVVVQYAAYSPGSIGIEAFIELFFQIFITDTIEQEELVPGRFWRNTELKVSTYSAPIFTV